MAEVPICIGCGDRIVTARTRRTIRCKDCVKKLSIIYSQNSSKRRNERRKKKKEKME